MACLSFRTRSSKFSGVSDCWEKYSCVGLSSGGVWEQEQGGVGVIRNAEMDVRGCEDGEELFGRVLGCVPDVWKRF
jgi:hypothetical protein